MEAHKLPECVPKSRSFGKSSTLLSDRFGPCIWPRGTQFYLQRAKLEIRTRSTTARAFERFGFKLRFRGRTRVFVIRDVFLIGMGPGRVQDRLLEEGASSPTVSIAKLLQISKLQLIRASSGRPGTQLHWSISQETMISKSESQMRSSSTTPKLNTVG